MSFAPIVLFVYKRPQHTLNTLESLAKNLEADQSELFIFCEAPKNPDDWMLVKEVREIVRQKQWCKVVHIIESESNLGCANSIIKGVTEICERYGRVIVLEDDLIVSPFFLQYMNAALELYADEPKVMQISGHMFPVQLKAETDAVFLPFTTSWGWATWQRAWQHFDPDMSGYEVLKRDRKPRYQFDLNGSYSYFSMLEAQRNGEIDTWAIRWYLSVFMQQGLTLFPVHSLVGNRGFDGSGTHCGDFSGNVDNFDGINFKELIDFPDKIEISSKIMVLIQQHFSPPNLVLATRRKIRSLLNF